MPSTWAYMFHCTDAVIYIDIPHYCTYNLKTMNCNIHLPCFCHTYATQNICSMCRSVGRMLMYVQHMMSLISTM